MVLTYKHWRPVDYLCKIWKTISQGTLHNNEWPSTFQVYINIAYLIKKFTYMFSQINVAYINCFYVHRTCSSKEWRVLCNHQILEPSWYESRFVLTCFINDKQFVLDHTLTEVLLFPPIFTLTHVWSGMSSQLILVEESPGLPYHVTVL